MSNLKILESIISTGINILRRDVNAIINYDEYVLQILFLKWLFDNHKNQTINKKNHDFNISSDLFWDIFNILSNESINDLITSIFQKIEDTNELLRGVFINPVSNQWRLISQETLQELINNCSQISLDNASLENPEVIVDCYERNFLEKSNFHRYNPNYLITPSTIRKLIISLLAPNTNMQICDPACGFGGILIECIRHFKKYSSDCYNLSLYGRENNYVSRSIAIISLILYGLGNPKISSDNLLATYLSQNNERDEDIKKFDLIITNPPFGVGNWKNFLTSPVVDSLFKYGVPPDHCADYAFIQCILEMLTQRGKAAVIVPYGVLFREGSEGKIRQRIIEDNLIEAVIGLPQELFNATRISTAIIIFNLQKIEERQNKILFIDASNQYEIKKRRRFLSEENINKIINTYKKFQEEIGYSFIATQAIVAKKKYTLDINQYVLPIELKKIEYEDINSQFIRLRELENKKSELQEKIDKCLRELKATLEF